MIKLKKFQNSKRKKIYTISFLSVALGICLIQVAYSRYMADVNMNAAATSGEMICDVEIDSDSSYIENNIAYFKIIVSNALTSKVSDTDVEYKLTISNKDGSNGLYYFVDSLGQVSDSNGEYHETLKTGTYTFNKERQEMVFKVYVKVPSNIRETVNFDVLVESVQKDMSK